MSQILTDAVPDVHVVKSESFKQIDGSASSQNARKFEENAPENPKNWPTWKKWCIVGSLAGMNFMSVFAPAAIVPAAPQVLHSFHLHSKIDRTLLVTIWGLGEGLVAPFVLAPLAERYGRLPVFHVGNFLSVLCSVASALSVNMSMLIAFQFLTGLCLPVTIIGPAVVGDLFEDEERGFIMSATFYAIVLADFVSPIIGSYTNQALGWRWILWLAAIAFGVVDFSSLFLMRETYAEKILARKASRDEDEQGDDAPAYHQSLTVLQGFMKPIQILFESPVVLVTSLCTAIIYGLLSLVFATLTEVMESTYHISQGSVGLVFLSLAIGNLIATVFYSLTSDRYIKYRKEKDETYKPEARLIHLLLAVVLFPCGLLLYGWTANYRVQYIVPLVGVAIDGACLTFALLATDTYLVDTFGTHGASAIAGNTVLRTTLATVLPLGGPALYSKVGLGWGNTILALIAAVLIPILLSLLRYGDWFRSKGKLRQDDAAGTAVVIAA